MTAAFSKSISLCGGSLCLSCLLGAFEQALLKQHGLLGKLAMLATCLGEQEEHWGSAGTEAAFPAFSPFPHGQLVAAPSLSFLSSALAAGCLQATQFAFPPQSPSPTLPQLLVPVPRLRRSSSVTVSRSSYGALHLCPPFPNVFLSLLFSDAFAFCREGAMPFWPRSLSFLPWCLPPCSRPCFFSLFYSMLSLSCDASLQTKSYSGEVES